MTKTKPVKKTAKKQKPKTLIGWQEWCALPDLNLPAIRAKVDTGARTSALHAYNIKPFTENGVQYVRFKIHPLHGNSKTTRTCAAPVLDQRHVTSSNGKREKRYVIKTTIAFEGKTIEAELTLTSRDKMAFRMLLGREALRKARFAVDPGKSFLLGKKTDVATLYTQSPEQGMK